MSVKQEKLKLISFVQQLQNQEMLRAMVRKAELEINGKMIETVKRLEDPVQRQRNLVEQERQKYLNEEEKKKEEKKKKKEKKSGFWQHT